MQLIQTTDKLYNSYAYPVYKMRGVFVLKNTIAGTETEYKDKEKALIDSVKLEVARRQKLKLASDRLKKKIKDNKK